jgi:predicted AAA+ superfamily ATPase
LDKIIALKDTPELIKVITGVRRCGKSFLLKLYRDYLNKQGVPASSVIYINLEDFQYNDIDSAKKLHDFISGKLVKKGITYIFIDEVQLVPSWEKAVNSLRLNRKNDIYLTGSNAYLLSSNLSTLLSGRYVEIKMLPLSFSEFLQFRDVGEAQDYREHFDLYLKLGGYPGLTELPDDSDILQDYLFGVFNTIIIKDIVTANRIRDVDVLEKIARYLSSNIGNITSARKISNYLISTGRKISADTADNYLRMLENAYCFYRAKRYDLKGKSLMKTNDKFYIVDLGLRNMFRGGVSSDYGSMLENVVYFELTRKGYTVSVGKYGDLEIDFVAEKSGKLSYFQVAATIIPDEVRSRELKSFRLLGDNYEKTILTMDIVGPYDDIDGIKHQNIIDFLLRG